MYLRSKTQGRLRCQKRRSLPQPVKKPQNHFHEYGQKVTVTTLFQTVPHRVFQLLAQTPHVRFHEQKRVHTRLSEKDRTQRLARRNRGRFGWGWYYYPRRALRAAETLDGRLQKRLTCRFLRSGEQRSLRSAYFLRIHRIFCWQFQLQTLLRYGTISSANLKLISNPN